MKKLGVLLLSLFLSLLLFSCEDKKFSDDSISVIFFTGDKAGEPGKAEKVDTLFNMQEGDLVPQPDDPVFTGYLFLGWFKEKTYTNRWDFDVDTVPGYSIILYAYFDAGLYNITYDLQGGTFTNPDAVPYSYLGGKRTSLPTGSNIKYEGYAFKGWSYVGGIYTVSHTFISMIDVSMMGDLHFYAIWDATTITVSFVSYNPETGVKTSPGGVKVVYGSLINFVIFDDTENYTFEGWCQSATNIYPPEEGGTAKYYKNGEPLTTGNRTLYAIWRNRVTGELCHRTS